MGLWCLSEIWKLILHGDKLMHISPIVFRLIPIGILAVAFITPAAARDKSDIIVLKNGNEVNGEIRNLERGMLTFRTDSMGTVAVKWEDVERITSTYLFTVEDTSGHRYVGSLQPAVQPRRVHVVGPKPVSDLHHISIVGIHELEGSLWNRFSGAIELGYTFTKASARTQFNVSSDLAYRSEILESSVSYDSLLSHSHGEKDVERNVLTLRAGRQIGRKWLLFALGKFEHNLELELDKRKSVLIGPGYNVHRSNRSSILLAGGVSYTRERYLDRSGVNTAEGAVGIQTDFFKLYTPKVDLTSTFYVIPNLTTSSRVRAEFSSKLRLEIFSDFFVNFSFYDSYDSKPPSETASKNDYGFVTGVSYSFRR